GIGLLEIAARQRHEVSGSRIEAGAHHPDVPGLSRAFEQGPDEPAVAEFVTQPAASYLLEHAPEHRPGMGIADVTAPGAGQVGKLTQLGRGVAAELHADSEP